MPRDLLLILCTSIGLAQCAPDTTEEAAAIMAKVAANVEKASEGRKQFIYRQQVRSSIVQTNGRISRKEKREYTVVPMEKGTGKKLVSFSGEYRKGKEMIAYSEPGFKYKGNDSDGELIEDLTKDLVDAKGTRDGIPHSLFPLRSEDLHTYRFTMKESIVYQGRRTYQIPFEPLQKNMCVHIGSDADNECAEHPWKGDAWIDAEELQPVRIITQLAFRIPWAVRFFLGTDLRQTGFSITYVRVAENIWFPSTYGTEFRLNFLWGYKRMIALSLESSDFRKTDVNSKIEFENAITR